jgi:parallel beta-helix repeat protein
MNHLKRNIMLGVALVGACLCGQNLLAQDVVVGTCINPSNTITTIQQGVNQAASGATVLVCPGKYPEQVEISEPLTLTGIRSGNADAVVITAPAGGVLANSMFHFSPTGHAAAQIWVHDTAGVTVSNLTVDGADSGVSTNSECNTLVGIYMQDASGTVKNVLTRNQLTGGCGSGDGALVVSDSGLNSTVTVKDSSFRSFDANGFLAQGSGTNVTFQSNTVEDLGQGQGVNGVFYFTGATGTIDSNSVIDALREGSGAFNIDTASCGIALQQNSAPVTVSGNVIGNTDCGVVLYDSSGNTISSNIIFRTPGTDGVFVCGNGNTVIDNTISDSHQDGVLASCSDVSGVFPGATANDNDVSKNTINGATFGVSMQSGATGDVTRSDKVFNVTHVNGTQTP